jgi:hypothetical protein
MELYCGACLRQAKDINDKQAYSMLERLLVNRYEHDSNKAFIMNKLSTGNSISHQKPSLLLKFRLIKSRQKKN